MPKAKPKHGKPWMWSMKTSRPRPKSIGRTRWSQCPRGVQLVLLGNFAWNKRDFGVKPSDSFCWTWDVDFKEKMIWDSVETAMNLTSKNGFKTRKGCFDLGIKSILRYSIRREKRRRNSRNVSDERLGTKCKFLMKSKVFQTEIQFSEIHCVFSPIVLQTMEWQDIKYDSSSCFFLTLGPSPLRDSDRWNGIC